MRSRAGAQQPGVDDAVRGVDPQLLQRLQAVLQKRMAQPGRQMPIPPEVYEQLARRAGMEDEARRMAATSFQQPGAAPVKRFKGQGGLIEGLPVNPLDNWR